MSQPPPLLLIHGSCHGAWAWDLVIPELEVLGHSARAIDLPGHGRDATPAARVTLDLYAEAIVSALREQGPSVLVGHSMGGYPITAAAARAPDLVRRLVYVCAYLPAPDLSLADMRRAGPRQPLAGAIRLSPDRAAFTFDPEQVEALFYHDCPPGAVEHARQRLTPQPVAPQETALPDLPQIAEIPKHYVICEDDRTIPPEYQETMSAGLAPGHVVRLPSSHSPFFSMPGRLARILSDIARQE
ncbi:MAG: alpha/beta fold hydrolase [Gemmobacter sp.]